MQAFQLEIHADPDAVVAQAIQIWKQRSTIAIADHGFFAVALSGGTTPKRLYATLAQIPDLDWQHTYLFWGDERYVPHDHADSNYRMTKDALIDQVPIPASQIFPYPTAAEDPELDAQRYAEQLQSVFKDAWPQFDLTLLGVGEDGHTASLFPGTGALHVEDRWVTVGSKSDQPRLTLTLPVLNHSQHVIFLVTGSSKANIIREILTTQPHLPAQQIRPIGQILWLLDSAAAAKLPLQTGMIASS